MSDSITGGPAFPAGNVRKERQRPGDAGSDFYIAAYSEPRHPGMTLRDYFAAKAIQGMFASDTNDWNEEGNWEARADAAYAMADAMLRTRK